jgi:PIN domain nuclease of toxin-antitoxin system
MNDSETDKIPDATNRQATTFPIYRGVFVAPHHVTPMEWARHISRDPVRRLAIARRIARETTLATTPEYARQTRLN